MYSLIKRKFFASKVLLVMLAVLIASPSFAFAAQPNQATSELSGHWAEKQITQWAANGLIAGYPDGTYRPDHSITRAEFITFVNRALHLTDQSAVGFSDVAKGSWEHEQIATALSAGYISGYEDGKFRPDREISREEAASVLNRALKLEPNAEAAAKFTDANRFANWSKGAVGALAQKGFLTGFEDGTFRPSQSMTRAEAVVILDRATATKTVAMTYDQKGTYGPETGTQVIEGNVVISAASVTLRNTIINGDLLLASSIGDGEVYLKGVTVKGTTDVQGGGVNSVYMEDSVLLSIIVNREDGTVRIVTEGKTSVKSVTLQSSAVLEASAQGVRIEDVILSRLLPAKSEATLVGSFSNLSVQAASIRVNLTSGMIDSLLIGAEATNSTINLNGSSTVSSMVLNAATTVTGTGTILRADVNANGSSFERLPQQVNSAPGVVIREPERTSNGTPGTSGPKQPPDPQLPSDPQQPAGYDVVGQILDADNQPVSGMTITFRQDWFTTTGPILKTLVTDQDGRYRIALPPGKYTGDLTKQGFLDSSLYLLIESNGAISGQDKKAVRIPQAEETRIVLYWGQFPQDLDSHLVGPTPDENMFHTRYLNKAYHYNGQKYVDLDIDHTQSWGPETTTIRHDVTGTYRFYVHNYSGNHLEGKTLRDSGATIEVYRGSSTVPVKSYQIPSGAGDELYYAAFEMTLHNGEASFKEINQFYATEAEAQGNISTVNKATVSSRLYYVSNLSIYVDTFNDNISAESFRNALIWSSGASLEVFESNGKTVRTGNIATGDLVIVTAPNGATKKIYSVYVHMNSRMLSRLWVSSHDLLWFTDPTPSRITTYAYYNDGTSEDVTRFATYQVQDPATAAVNEAGVVTPLSDGRTVLNILYGGKSTLLPVTVQIYTPIPRSLTVLPSADFTLTSLEELLPFQIMAEYSDGSTKDVTSQAHYGATYPNLITIDPRKGTLKANDYSGRTDISVVYGGIGVDMHVLVNLPGSPIILYPQSNTSDHVITSLDPQSIPIMAKYIDGTTQDVTRLANYSVEDPSLLTVDRNNGTITAVGHSGITNIKVSFGGRMLTLKIIVSLPDSPIVEYLEKIPTHYVFTSLESPKSFKITAHYYGGTSEDVTSRAEYYDANSNVITIDRNNGTLNAAGQSGETYITVSFGGHAFSMYANAVLPPSALKNGTHLQVSNLCPYAEVWVYDAASQLPIIGATADYNGKTSFTNLKSGTSYYVIQKYRGITSGQSNVVTL